MKNTDKHFSYDYQEKDYINWINPRKEEKCRHYGFAWFEEDRLYRRFPLKASATIKNTSAPLDNLADNTAGGQLHFRTDSPSLHIAVVLKEVNGLSGMSAAAQGGFDCYVGSDYYDLKHYATTAFSPASRDYRYTFFADLPGEKLIVLNFPLYNKIESFQIGIKPEAKLFPAADFPHRGRIVIYGTSITQGGCAGRPGLCYTNILSRRLGMEVINMGFSGNAFGEKEVAAIIAGISEARMFILDYEANAGLNGKLFATLENFIDTIRNKYATIPIAVVSRIKYLYDELSPATLGKVRAEIKKFQIDTVGKYNSAGDANIHFIDGANLLGADYH